MVHKGRDVRNASVSVPQTPHDLFLSFASKIGTITTFWSAFPIQRQKWFKYVKHVKRWTDVNDILTTFDRRRMRRGTSKSVLRQLSIIPQKFI